MYPSKNSRMNTAINNILPLKELIKDYIQIHLPRVIFTLKTGAKFGLNAVTKIKKNEIMILEQSQCSKTIIPGPRLVKTQ